MSKGVLKNYSFNVAAKTITLTDVTTVRLDKLALITDVTTNKILYNFADSTVATATVSTNVITLSALQGGEANSDKLRIDYDVESSDASAFTDTALATSATQSGTWNIATLTGITNVVHVDDNSGSLTVDNGGTFAVQAAQSGTWNITNISGTITLPTGAATSAKQPALGTAGTASADVITVQGIASMTALKVDGSGVTQPVSWSGQTVTVTQSTASSLKVDLSGTGANATAIKVDNSAVTQPTAEVAPTTVLMGKKTVTTAGTRVTLASSTTCKSVTIKALSSNTGTIYVGDTTVASTNGFQLAAGDSVSLDIANLNTVNLDSSVNGEGVTYLGVN